MSEQRSSGGKKRLDWWQENVIYQVYPLSFKDSNGDGVGDLKGILEKLDYFQWLGIRVLWLNPIYKTPMECFSYDIVDYTDIDKLFGNMDDFKQLIKEMHKREMYLILDFVPNHTSWKHQWFEASVKKQGCYTDYYVWKDGKMNENGKVEPPNNWKTVFETCAWTWNEERKQYYLHQFVKEIPDLNFRNQLVQDEMKKVLQFWLSLDVDGFRVDAIRHLVEHESFADNASDDEKFGLNVDQPETYHIVSDWVQLIRKYGQDHNKHIFMVTEAYSKTTELMNYYQVGVDFPFNFALINWNKETSVAKLKEWILEWMKEMPKGSWPNWNISNHDNKRIATRLGGREYTDVANMLLLLLPGTPTCYYGDELGMNDVEDTFPDGKNPFTMKFGPEEFATKVVEPWRTPMVWSTEPNGGFTNATAIPWMPVLKDYKEICVEKQKANSNSHLNLFKTLLKIRQEPAFLNFVDNLKFIDTSSTTNPDTILAFVRSVGENDPSYLVALNLGREIGKEPSEVFDLSDSGMYFQGKIVAHTTNVTDESYTVGSAVDLKNVKLSAAQGLIIEILRKRPLSPSPAEVTEEKTKRKRFIT